MPFGPICSPPWSGVFRVGFDAAGCVAGRDDVPDCDRRSSGFSILPCHSFAKRAAAGRRGSWSACLISGQERSAAPDLPSQTDRPTAKCRRRHEIVLLMDRELAAENIFPDIQRAVVDMGQRQSGRAGVGGSQFVPGPGRGDGDRSLAARRAVLSAAVDVSQECGSPLRIGRPRSLPPFLPQYLSPQQRYFRLRNYAYSISRADRIIAISQFTKKTIVEQYGVAPERITVIPHGWEPVQADSATADRDRRQISLLPGHYPAPQKSPRVLFESIAALKALGTFRLRLVLSGIQTPHWNTLGKQISRLPWRRPCAMRAMCPRPRMAAISRRPLCVVSLLFRGFRVAGNRGGRGG